MITLTVNRGGYGAFGGSIARGASVLLPTGSLILAPVPGYAGLVYARLFHPVSFVVSGGTGSVERGVLTSDVLARTMRTFQVVLLDGRGTRGVVRYGSEVGLVAGTRLAMTGRY